jgi:hypothetical protein
METRKIQNSGVKTWTGEATPLRYMPNYESNTKMYVGGRGREGVSYSLLDRFNAQLSEQRNRPSGSIKEEHFLTSLLTKL